MTVHNMEKNLVFSKSIRTRGRRF